LESIKRDGPARSDTDRHFTGRPPTVRDLPGAEGTEVKAIGWTGAPRPKT